MAYWALTCALSLFLLIYQHVCFNFTKILVNTHAILKFYLLKLVSNHIIILLIIITCYCIINIILILFFIKLNIVCLIVLLLSEKSKVTHKKKTKAKCNSKNTFTWYLTCFMGMVETVQRSFGYLIKC